MQPEQGVDGLAVSAPLGLLPACSAVADAEAHIRTAEYRSCSVAGAIAACFAEGWQAQVSELSWLAGAGPAGTFNPPARGALCLSWRLAKHDFNQQIQISKMIIR